MKIAVSSQGSTMESRVDPRFGRALYFMMYDTDNDSVEVISNAPNTGAAQGAGVQAAQLVVQHGARTVVSTNVGPKAFQALQAAGVTVLSFGDGTVQEAVDAVRNNQLTPHNAANVRGHWS